jgi:hypothetical protein
VALGKVIFILLNPSTADATNDDPTIERCIDFAKTWGYGSLEVVNLFAYRATSPSELLHCDDPVGTENDMYILKAAEGASKIILGWGNDCSFSTRDEEVLKLLKRYKMDCLIKNNTGKPRHPLYISKKAKPIPFNY